MKNFIDWLVIFGFAMLMIIWFPIAVVGAVLLRWLNALEKMINERF